MTDQHYLTMQQAAELAAEWTGQIYSAATVRRWRRDGTAGRRLRATRVGNRYLTTEAWLRDFLEGDPDKERRRAAARQVALDSPSRGVPTDPELADAVAKRRAERLKRKQSQ